MPNPSTSNEGNSQLWDRLPDEPNKWFDRFSVYLRLGASRSVYAAFQADRKRRGRDESARKRAGLPQSWLDSAQRWRWQERSEAFDEHQRDLDREEWESRRAALREQEWKVAQDLIDKAKQMLVFPLAVTTRTASEDGTEVKTEVHPTRWTMADAARLLETASKMARLAAEMETSRSKVDLDNMTDAQIVELIKTELAARAAGSTESDQVPAGGRAGAGSDDSGGARG